MDICNLQKIKPYSKNAKKHPDKQVQQIADSIKAFGFNQPIVIDKNNIIIIGHGRYEAAKLLGLKKGAKSVIDGVTWISTEKEGEDKGNIFPKMYHLFHKSQVEAIK